ncbi:hypothetical protein BX070DRAFT_230842 [Coemansia spiralis]|nr:hypothetical protein BX070DRAFT_230842 [Coemansia spiralis]
MPPESFDLRQSLLGSTLGSSLLTDTTHLDAEQSSTTVSSFGERPDALGALNRLGRAAASTHAEPAEFPDSLEFMGDEASNGLTLLPTAEYSDDEDDEASQFEQFADARVVCDPHTGQVVLQPHGDRPAGKDTLGRKDIEHAEQQGREIATIIGSKGIHDSLDTHRELAKHSMAMFSASEQYDAYRTALERRLRLDEKLAAGKRQRQSSAEDHDMVVDGGSLVPNIPLNASGLSSAFDITSRHALPPETGEFITSRTAKGKALYFAVRSSVDAEKQLGRIAALRNDGRMSTSQINRTVADIESELDTVAALTASRVDTADDMESAMDTEPIPSSHTKGKGHGAANTQDNSLWVDKYRARTFLDLVSDERTNRAVMQWLKEWDYCVFGREKPKHGTADSQAADKWKRPHRRILLLSGAPGLGKTTLAHVAARQAGYSTIEINASDDRTAGKIKDRVLGVTQTHAVGVGGSAQLLVIDEIDGASGAQSAQGDFVSMLVALATADQRLGEKKKRHTGDPGPLLRPIICICNNVYAPVLRPLRQIALCYHVAPPTSVRLAKRLEEVCTAEGVAADAWGLVELARQSEGDIRSCLNTLQLLCAQARSVSIENMKGASVGAKDVQRSLFAVWAMVFTRPDASSLASSRGPLGGRGGRHQSGRAEHEYAARIVSAVRSSGEHERLMQGCFENYLRMDFRDLTHTRVSDLCTRWLSFFDTVDLVCRKNPQFADSLHSYLDYAVLAVHRTCSTPMGLSRGDFEYPHTEFEAFQARQTAQSILQSLIAGIEDVRTRPGLGVNKLALCADYLLHILSPQLVTSNKHLLKGEEKARFDRLIDVMSRWQLSFVQTRDADGQFVYKLEPQLDRLFGFGGRRAPGILPMRYPVRQLLAQELECVRIARAAARHLVDAEPTGEKVSAKDAAKRDYLTKLFADPLAAAGAKNKNAAEGETAEPVVVTRDFFGRIVTKSKKQANSTNTPVEGSGPAEQSNGSAARTWFHFYEGFSNAVRKPTQMKELF